MQRSNSMRLFSARRIEKKRNAFIKKIEYLRELELADESTFRVIFTGMQYLLDIPVKFSSRFYDIAVMWIETVQQDCRKLLNYFNMKLAIDVSVYSTIAKSITCGRYNIKRPCVNGVESDLWLDFNFGTQSISFFCDMDNFDEENSERWASIDAGVAKLTWKNSLQLIIEINGLMTCNGDALQNIDLKSIKEIVVSLTESSAKALRLSAINKRMNLINNEDKDRTIVKKLEKTNLLADINSSLEKQKKFPESICMIENSGSNLKPPKSTTKIAPEKTIYENQLDAIDYAQPDYQSRKLQKLKRLNDKTKEIQKFEFIEEPSNEKKYLRNEQINTRLPYVNNVKQLLSNNNAESVLSHNSKKTQIITEVRDSTLNMPVANQVIYENHLKSYNCPEQDRPNSLFQKLQSFTDESNEIQKSSQSTSRVTVKRTLFNNEIKSVSSQNSKDTQIKRSNYLALRRIQIEQSGIRKLLNIVEPLKRGKANNNNESELKENRFNGTDCQNTKFTDFNCNNDIRSAKKSGFSPVDQNIEKINDLIEENQINETNDQSIKFSEFNSKNQTRFEPKRSYGFSRDKLKVIGQNIEKINEIGSKPQKTLKRPREKIYCDLYKKPKNHIVRQKKNISSKPVRQNEKAKFYSQNSSSKKQNIKRKYQVSAQKTPKENLKTSQSKINDAKESNSLVRKSATCSNQTSITHNLNESKRKLEDDTVIQPNPKRRSFCSDVKSNDSCNDNIDNKLKKTAAHPELHKSYNPPRVIAEKNDDEIVAINMNIDDKKTSSHEIPKDSLTNSVQVIEIDSDSEYIQLNTSDLGLSSIYEKSNLHNWIIDRFLNDLSSTQSVYSCDSKNENDTLRAVVSRSAPIISNSTEEIAYANEENGKINLNVTFIIEQKCVQVQIVENICSGAMRPLETNKTANDEMCREMVASEASSKFPNRNHNEITAVATFLRNGTLSTNFISTLKCSLDSLCKDIINENSQNCAFPELNKEMEDIITNITKHLNKEMSLESARNIQNLLNDTTEKFNALIEYTTFHLNNWTKEIEFLLSQLSANNAMRNKLSSENFHNRNNQFTTKLSDMIRSKWQAQVQNSAKNIFDSIMKHSNIE